MQIIFKPRFVTELNGTLTYISEHSLYAREKFLDDLMILISKKIPPQPFLYPEFSKMRTTAKVFRRALFKKKWNVVYKVEPDRLLFISIFHSSRNIAKMKFDY
ncbi:MAG: hypothetical protein IPN76_16090 [Saprospiraceae bacterium]|nr:hypothetical protein [Saprospiraceae bacterium]